MTTMSDSQARAAFLAHIARHRSVTGALAAWCAQHGIGAGPIRVERLPVQGGMPVPEALALLPGEHAARRRVRLMRGAVRLAEAENLYVPERLPPGVARALAETDTPFGALLAGHGFARRPIAPPPSQGADEGALETAALITLSGRPVAQVRERFAPLLLG